MLDAAFDVVVEPEPGLARVRVTGEVDVSTSARVQEAIEQAVTLEGVQRVIVDLGAVTFLDSSGMTALVIGRRRAQDNGVALMVDHAGRQVRRVLEIAGLLAFLGPGAG